MVFGQKIWNDIDFSVLSNVSSAHIQPKTYLAKLWYWINGFWPEDEEQNRWIGIFVLHLGKHLNIFGSKGRLALLSIKGYI